MNLLLAIEGAPAAGKTVLIERMRRADDVVLAEPLTTRPSTPWRHDLAASRARSDLWFLGQECRRWEVARTASGRVLFDRCLLSQLVHWRVRRRIYGFRTAPAVRRYLERSIEAGRLGLPPVLVLHPPDGEWERRARERLANAPETFDPEPLFRSDDYLIESRASYALLVVRCSRRQVEGEMLYSLPATSVRELATELDVD